MSTGNSERELERRTCKALTSRPLCRRLPRHGTTTPFAALNEATGKVLAR